MKRLCLPLFLALILVLSACGAAGQAPSAGQSGPAPSQAAQSPTPSPDPPGARGSRGGRIHRGAAGPLGPQQRRHHGPVLVLRLVQLTGDTEEAQAVNDSLSAHCDEFFVKDVGDVPLDKDHAMVWRNTAEATVTENEGGLFSVRMDTDWYMGGVYNSNSLGYTYDLATGEELGLADLTGQDPDALAATLRELVKAYMAGQPEAGWWDDAADIVDSRSLEDMIFWVDGGEIVLCFPTYELTIGAYGPVIIPTGVMAEH